MKHVSFILICALTFFSCGTSQDEVTTLYVSVEKTDQANGRKSQPFSSLEDAIQNASELKQGNPDLDIDIRILAGEYNLEKAIKITPELSGISIIGSDASDVTLKGSKTLALKWESYNDHIFMADVDEDLDFDQLVINGESQILARYPNYDEASQYWQGSAPDAISKERIASWKNPEGTYFHALHGGKWGGFHFVITGVNEDGTAILEGGHQNNRSSKPHKEFRMVENVFEELDSPGEWYLDTDTHKLYYWPTQNQNLETSTVEVAVLKDLIQVVGTLENPVKDVTISGITFKYTKRTFMENYEQLLRSDWSIYRGGVLFFEGTENCEVTDSEFTNLGGNVIMVSKYNSGLQVKGNHIHENGASAVSFVGDPSAVRSPSFNYGEFVDIKDMDTISGPKNELYPRNSVVENNLIYRIGRIEKQTAGVEIAMAMDITVSHNSIYDVPRAGINIGDGTWGGHILEYNDVFNTVLETSDHGSFNSWGRDRFWHPKRDVMDSLTTEIPDMYTWDAVKTTIIRNNRFRCDHGWDIDLDDGSSNYHIYNNLMLNNGLKLREGFNRVVENNIMVNNSFHMHVWFGNSEDVFKKNIVGDVYKFGTFRPAKELDYNLFPNEVSMMIPQMYGSDMHSAYGDPLYKDPAHLDFSVTSNSPALKLGFKNFPMDQFGVQKEDLNKIAKTPEIPVIKGASGDTSSQEVVWLRNTIKNVDSEQEQSVYGLFTAEGVIIIRARNLSPAVQNNGIKTGDVILQVDGKSVKNIQDFFKINVENKTDEMELLIMRNQAEKRIKIRTN
ncbi:right-handed parallel beta-helix repeat-containing protein [Formosa undariae]|uniref:Right-handed parallel beta-helix repeat-containing protein n=1 Tax=Formosa undariae TaxID=1325436 RepID=A0ABV5F3W5_9FLAO